MGVPLPPEGVEAQVLQIHVSREALAGVGDRAVPRAAAEISRHGPLRLSRREPREPLGRGGPPPRLGLGPRERGGEGHAHPGRAEAALRGVEPREPLVHGVEAAAAPEPLGGGHGAVMKAVHQREAGARRRVRHRARRRVVGGEEHHARAASAFAAAELGPGEAGAGAEELEERGAGVHVPLAELNPLPVYSQDRRR